MNRFSAFLQHSFLLLISLVLLKGAGRGRCNAFVFLGSRRGTASCLLHRRRSLLFLTQLPSDERSVQGLNGTATTELLSEEDKLQMQLNATMEDPSYLGFTPSNFDSTALPIPLFTSIIVLFFSLYATFYGIYVGLNGFPAEESSLPRIF